MTTTTITEKITRERLEELLAQAVAQRGEGYVYQRSDSTCLYVHDRDSDNPQPGCIIGLVFQLHTGQPVPEEREGHTASDLGVWADKDAAKVADRVQNNQDSGVPWGSAVALGLVEDEDEDEDEDTLYGEEDY